MLSSHELDTVAARFGVAEEQLRRDHLISHLLAALSAAAAGEVVFFGGTALARTHVPAGRLSEDIDLVARERRSDVASQLEDLLVTGVRREFPGLRWMAPLSAVRDTEPGMLVSPEGLVVRVQLLSPTGHPPWPTETRALVQRYEDAPTARLTVPTRAAFVAAKTVAWVDRHAARDLFDLYQLARSGAVDGEAAALYRRYGPTAHAPGAHDFTRAPDAATWHRELSGQTRLTVSATDALVAVADAWASVASR